MYRLKYSHTSLEDLNRLGQKNSKRITDKLFWFAVQDNIFNFSKRLQGQQNRYRLRVGQFRVIFQLDEGISLNVLYILRVNHRKDIYKQRF